MVSQDALRKSQQVVDRCRVDESSDPYRSLLADRLQSWATVSAAIQGNPFTSDGERHDFYEWDEQTKRTLARDGLSADDELVKKIKNTWLCTPKAFRFIEKIGDELKVDLRGFDTFDKEAFRHTITDCLRMVDTAISTAEDGNGRVCYFLLSLLKAKLNEYTQNGILKKVFKT